MGNSPTKTRYEVASKTGALNLTNNGLAELPSKLKEISPSIRALNMSNNKFRKMPADIGLFVNLKTLNMDSNKMDGFCKEISQLQKLEVLSANKNCITTVPSLFSALISLKEVYLSDNKLEQFPVALCFLDNLNIVDLSKNSIKIIPSCVATLKASELNLNENEIHTIANELGKAPKLKILRLEKNCLTVANFPKAILTDSNISALYLSDNAFSMKELEQADGYEKYMDRYTATKKKMF